MSTEQEIIDDLKRVAKLLNSDYLSGRVYGNEGRFGLTTIRYRFGSWNNAKVRAGLSLHKNDQQRRKLADADLLKHIVDLTLLLKKMPSEYDVTAAGVFSNRPYSDRWGSFVRAREKAYLIYGNPLVK